jgi:hypothetical protein
MAEFRFGIEEEYFVVDRRTASVKVRVSRPFMAAAKRKLGPRLMYELLQSQIEVATTPIGSSHDARQQLKYFRSTLAEIGRETNGSSAMIGRSVSASGRYRWKRILRGVFEQHWFKASVERATSIQNSARIRLFQTLIPQLFGDFFNAIDPERKSRRDFLWRTTRRSDATPQLVDFPPLKKYLGEVRLQRFGIGRLTAEADIAVGTDHIQTCTSSSIAVV